MRRSPSAALLLFLLVSHSGRAMGGQNRLSAELPAPSDHQPYTKQIVLTGRVTGEDEAPVPRATVRVDHAAVFSDARGNFRLRVPVGDYKIQVSASGYMPLAVHIGVTSDTVLNLQLGFPAATTVTAQVDANEADPSRQIFSIDDLQLADPGRPGTPVSLPGYPSETASGGVKAPQYFAPGVAGDHGEPIAQYIQIGDFLFPNNLPANAHGNGYADPNLLIPAAIGNVQSDAGAFDVRHGNNAVNLAVAYDLRPRLEPFLQFSSDGRDYDMATGWSPTNPQIGAWLGVEVAGGNGFLALPEHRRQYKLNGLRSFSLGSHQLTLFAAGYYGSSRIPGLVPIDVRVPGGTIDPRQSDRTHTSLWVASDTWQVSARRQFQFSGFFRTYNLDLASNFGNGLIRQSEFRTVAGGNTSYHQQWNRAVSVEAGFDLRRDAPHGAQLSRLDSNGVFQPVTRNDFTIDDAAPYVSLSGAPWQFVNYYVGVRRDQIGFSNADELNPRHSYQAHSGVTSPRATIALHPAHLPSIAFSYGEAFHTNDPRIGVGVVHGTPVAASRAYQTVVTESVKSTQFSVTLARVSNSQEFARLDPDTGLQQNVGASLVRSFTASVHRHFSFGSLQATFARARALDRLTGQDVPEAPRLIWDVSATSVPLPHNVRASAGFEYEGQKPLGDGFIAIPVREIHCSISRPFSNGLFDAGIYFLLASGYTGQTLGTLRLPDEYTPVERIVGVRKPSYVGITISYHSRREHSY